jgi:hypothetical protein
VSHDSRRHTLCIHSLLHAIHKRHTSAFAQHPPLSLACHCPVSRDTPRQTPCISYLSHAFRYSLRDLSESDKQRHTLCVRSLSHAVRCLATAEGIPYASFLHPLSLACRPVSRDSYPMCPLSHTCLPVCLRQTKAYPTSPSGPRLAPLIDFERGAPAPPRRSRAGSLRAAGQCSEKTETEIHKGQQRRSVSVESRSDRHLTIEKHLCICCISCMRSSVSRPTKAYPMYPLRISTLSNVVHCFASVNDILSATVHVVRCLAFFF